MTRPNTMELYNIWSDLYSGGYNNIPILGAGLLPTRRRSEVGIFGKPVLYILTTIDKYINIHWNKFILIDGYRYRNINIDWYKSISIDVCE